MCDALVYVFSSPSSASVEQLAQACKYCATEESSVDVLERQSDLHVSVTGLLYVSLEGRGDNDDPSLINLRRARLALRVLVNCLQRSQRLREAVDSSTILLWRALLRIPELLCETCACLLAVALPMHLACSLHSQYPQLLSDLALLWETASDRSWISALFAVHLEKDYAFLAHCFADFPSPAFTSLLRVTETLLDTSETDLTFKIHPNNVLFALNYLERLLYDMAESEEKRSTSFLEPIIYASEIIASAALRSGDYGKELLLSTTAVEIVVDILQTVLHAQAIAEALDPIPESVHSDRPARAKTPRFPKVEEDGRLSVLSSLLVEAGIEVRGDLKCAAVRCIGNLCCDSAINRIAAGSRGGIIAVLQCAKIGSGDKPFIMQWSIAALRHMCMDCVENQNIVLSIDEKPTGIVDREKLFKELGLQLEVDEKTGKMKIKKP